MLLWQLYIYVCRSKEGESFESCFLNARTKRSQGVTAAFAHTDKREKAAGEREMAQTYTQTPRKEIQNKKTALSRTLIRKSLALRK